jgi:hypothetical protein
MMQPATTFGKEKYHSQTCFWWHVADCVFAESMHDGRCCGQMDVIHDFRWWDLDVFGNRNWLQDNRHPSLHRWTSRGLQLTLPVGSADAAVLISALRTRPGNQLFELWIAAK